MTGLPQLALGTAVLAAERLIGRRTSPGSPVAVVVGLTGLGRQGVAMAVGSTDSSAKRAVRPEVSLDGLRKLVRDAGTRGAITMVRSRRAAQASLRAAVDDSAAWAGRTLAPRVVDEMLPYLIRDVAPKVIDGVMPRVREKVIPVVVADLTDDPKMREAVSEFVREQSQGMLSDATIELRETSASADDRVESAFRRVLRNTPGR